MNKFSILPFIICVFDRLGVMDRKTNKVYKEDTCPLLQFLHLKSGREGLFQLFCLFLLMHDQGVEVSGTSNLELDIVFVSLDFDRLGILLSGRLEEVFDLLDFPWHGLLWVRFSLQSSYLNHMSISIFISVTDWCTHRYDNYTTIVLTN